MSVTAHIAGSLACALLSSEDAYEVIGEDGSVRTADSRDLVPFRSSAIEIQRGEFADRAAVRDQITVLRNRNDGLRMAITGLDSDASLGLRADAIACAEELMEDSDVHTFVRHRLLGQPTPQTADLDAATRLATEGGFERMGALCHAMHASAGTLVEVQTAWVAVVPEFIQDLSDQDEALWALVDSGAIAAFAETLTTGEEAKLDGVVFEFGLRLEHFAVPQPIRLLNALKAWIWSEHSFTYGARHQWESDASKTSRTHEEAVREEIAEIIASFTQRKKSSGGRDKRARRRDESTLARIRPQIDMILRTVEEGDMLRAWRYLRDLLAFQKENSQKEDVAKTLSKLATSLRSKGELSLASEWIGYARQLGVEDPVVFNIMAEHHRATGDFENALSAYDAAVSRFPNDVVTHNGRAETLRALGRLDDALAAYEAAVSRFPNDVVAHSGRAETLRALGRLDDALAAYEVTAEAFPNNVVPRNGRAETLRSLGRLDDALAAYEATASRFPNDAVARSGRAEVLRAMGRLDDALMAYEATAEAFPNDAFARNGRAQILLLLRRFSDARNSLTTQRSPMSKSDWIGRHILGMVELRSGDSEAAKAIFLQGANECPWYDSRQYFRGGLAVARLMEREFEQVLALLGESTPIEQGLAGQTQRLLVAHAQAGLERKDNARATLGSLGRLVDRDAVALYDALKWRFMLNGASGPPTLAEEKTLDNEIIEREVRLVLFA